MYGSDDHPVLGHGLINTFGTWKDGNVVDDDDADREAKTN
jgi:hypothetical protein